MNARITQRKRENLTRWQVKHLSGADRGATFYFDSLTAARIEALWLSDFLGVVTAIYPPQYQDDY